jgi:hypothetical protein
MKKGLATLLVLLALFAAAEPASAGTCRRRVTLRRSYSRAYYPRSARAGYARSCRAYNDRRTVYYVRNRRSLW